MTERTRSKRPPASLVFWASILLFAALFALLAYRFSAEQASQATARAVQVRKVIKRRVVTTIVPSPGQNTVSASPVSSSSSYSAGAEPVVTSSS
ncbi:MAG TPA: hypothetical protein VEP91_04350 [Solirubrobacterales bacterium]|nr:hypothetical protein [Solirubrobacterales bacterium]